AGTPTRGAAGARGPILPQTGPAGQPSRRRVPRATAALESRSFSPLTRGPGGAVQAKEIGGIKRVGLLLAVIAPTLLGVRAYDSLRFPPLELWHRYVLVELSVKELDAADWDKYLKAEAAIFDGIRAEVTQKLEPDAKVPTNRYFEGSPVYPAKLTNDWNRS